MKKRSIVPIIMFGMVCFLTACTQIPTSIRPDSVPNAYDSGINPPPPPHESQVPEISGLELIALSDGQQIQRDFSSNTGGVIVIDAVVDASFSGKIQQYEYTCLPITEILRNNLFVAYFGERAGEMKQTSQNPSAWILANSTAGGDYYKFTTVYPQAGSTIPGEESFSLEYRLVDLYPFDDNLLATVKQSTCVIAPEKAIDMCDQIMEQISKKDDYIVDYILAYGSNGRNPYYKICYKRHINGMPVTAYNDIYFLVDDSGIQKIFGSVYDITPKGDAGEFISVYTAVDILGRCIDEINFRGADEMYIGRISLEYIVTCSFMGEIQVSPAWRFEIGKTDEELNTNRRTIVAVDAVSGELIQGRRGTTF